jgi:hypothetical protein
VALYEPPLSIGDSAPTDWVPRYGREVDSGKTADALVTALKGLGAEPTMRRIPRFLLVPVLRAGMKSNSTAEGDDVPIAALIPTMRYDMMMVGELADTVDDYSAISAEILLLGGSRSPRFLGTALDALARVLPKSRRVTFRGLGHSGPDDGGKPERVAEVLDDFFA